MARKVHRNRVSEGLAEAIMNKQFMREQGFHPSDPPEIYVIGGNPTLGAEIERRTREAPGGGFPLTASFTMGLASGFGAEETFEPNAIRLEAMKYFPKGGTLGIQLGWFEGTEEDSVRMSIENTGMGLSDKEFIEKLEDMVREFVRKFRQKSIWLDYYRGNEVVERVTFDWKD